MFYMDMKDEFSVSLSVLRMVGLSGSWTYKDILVFLVDACALYALIGCYEMDWAMDCRLSLKSFAVFFDRSQDLSCQGRRQLIVLLSRALHIGPRGWRKPVGTKLDCLAADLGVLGRCGGGAITIRSVSSGSVRCTFSRLYVVVVHQVTLLLAGGVGTHFLVFTFFSEAVQLALTVAAVLTHQSDFSFHVVVTSHQVVIVHGTVSKVLVAEVGSQQIAALSHALQNSSAVLLVSASVLRIE